MFTNRTFQGLVFTLFSSLFVACGASGTENARDPSAKNEPREPGQSPPVTTVEIPNATAENNTAANADAEKPVDTSPPSEEDGVEGGVEGGIEGGVVGTRSVPNDTANNKPIRSDVPAPFGTEMTRPKQVSGPVVTEGLKGMSPGLWAARCIIIEDGSVTACKVIKSLPSFDEQMVKNLQAQKYTPVMYQGKPQRVFYKFVVRFK